MYGNIRVIFSEYMKIIAYTYFVAVNAWDRIFQCSRTLTNRQGCPRTLRVTPASASRVLHIKAFTTIPDWGSGLFSFCLKEIVELDNCGLAVPKFGFAFRETLSRLCVGSTSTYTVCFLSVFLTCFKWHRPCWMCLQSSSTLFKSVSYT